MFATKLMRKFSIRRSSDILAKMQDIQYWPHEKVRDFQFKKMQSLLAHAFVNVPYYRQVAKQLGISSHDVRTFEDFRQLPILTKDIIRENFDSLLATNMTLKERVPNATGGSTGEPLHFFQDQNYHRWADAARLRGWYQIAGCDYWAPCAVLWGAMHEVKEDFSLRERARDYLKTGEIVLNAFNLSDDRKRSFLRLCKHLKPKLLRGYFSAVKDFAQFLQNENLQFPPIKGVILCAETVDEVSRIQIESVFQAPAFNSYGGRELSLIAMECQYKNGLHEISENNYVEIDPIDLQGYEGRAGNLLITNLNNFVMPFIRYQIGDIGISSNVEECPCGRGLPLIDRVIGRTTEVLSFSGGVKIAGEMFIHLMKDFPVRDYQFVQVAEDRILLRFPKYPGINKSLREQILNQYSGYLPVGVSLDFDEVEKIEKTTTGKFRFVLREELMQ